VLLGTWSYLLFRASHEFDWLPLLSCSQKGRGLSRPNLNLDHANGRRPGCARRLKVQFQGFLQVGESFFFGLALAGDIDLEALRDVPVSLAPYCRCEWSLYNIILPQAGGPLRTVAW